MKPSMVTLTVVALDGTALVAYDCNEDTDGCSE